VFYVETLLTAQFVFSDIELSSSGGRVRGYQFVVADAETTGLWYNPIRFDSHPLMTDPDRIEDWQIQADKAVSLLETMPSTLAAAPSAAGSHGQDACYGGLSGVGTTDLHCWGSVGPGTITEVDWAPAADIFSVNNATNVSLSMSQLVRIYGDDSGWALGSWQGFAFGVNLGELEVQSPPEVPGGTATVNGTPGLETTLGPAPSGTNLTCEVTAGPDEGSVTLAADGTPTYANADPATPGDHTFQVSCTDDLGQEASGDYTVTTRALPTAEDKTATIDKQHPDPVIFVPDVNAAGPVTGVVSTQPDEGTVSIDPATGAVTYTPVADPALGEHTFSVTWTDEYGQTVTQNFTVTVVTAPEPTEPATSPTEPVAPTVQDQPANVPDSVNTGGTTPATTRPLLAIIGGMLLMAGAAGTGFGWSRRRIDGSED
jgi:hypothetical protein